MRGAPSFSKVRPEYSFVPLIKKLARLVAHLAWLILREREELLLEDFAAGTLLWLMALIPLLFDILEPQPSDSPFWQLMIPGILRFRKCMEVIGCSDLVERVVSEIEAEKA